MRQPKSRLFLTTRVPIKRKPSLVGEVIPRSKFSEFRKINNIKINIVIQMEEQTQLSQQPVNLNGHLFGRLFLETSQLPSQKCVLDYNFNYDPFSYYHPYWGLQNHFDFNKQYLNAALYCCYSYEHQEQPKIEIGHLRGAQDNTLLLENSFKVNSQPEEGEIKNSDLRKK